MLWMARRCCISVAGTAAWRPSVRTTARGWPWLLAAGVAGLTLGAAMVSAGALLLYGGRGVLRSAGFLLAVGLAAVAAGLWVGAPTGPRPAHRRLLGRWTFATIALVIASFVAGFWFRSPALQSAPWVGPLALVLLLAEPAYAIGALLAGLGVRRGAGAGADGGADGGAAGGRPAGVAVPALVGAAVGVVLATSWLIPAFPPGLVFLGLALLLTAAGSLEMRYTGGAKEDVMADRVVIVTGVGDPGQVGYAVAEAFAREGCRLVVTSRGEEIGDRARALGAATGGDSVVGVAADLSEPAGAAAVVEAARDRWGRLDALVNVAGGLHVVKSVADTSPEEWQREVDSNARTAFLVSRAALPLLRESRGVIVNFASPAGLRAVAGMAAYSAGKAGVVALTRALAREEKGSGVRVNAVAPGMIDTAQNRAAVSEPESVEWVTREQVVDVVMFLAGAAGSGIHGETVSVTGC